jgi:hypothetical protein
MKTKRAASPSGEDAPSMRTDAELADFVRQWNKRHPVGTTVALREQHRVLGPTEGKARVMGCTPVVQIVDMHGVWHLEKLEVVA